MDKYVKYIAMELSFPEDVDDEFEMIEELINHLDNNGYDFYVTHDNYFNQIVVLIVNEDEFDYVITILEDRNIEYSIKTI